MRIGIVGGALLALALCVGCGGSMVPEEDCENGTDDDGDGLTDADDPSCGGCVSTVSQENTALTDACENGVDEDCDGLVDCDDPDCAVRCGGAEVCDNGADDDGDGDIDCADADCECASLVEPTSLEVDHVVGETECPQDLGGLTFAGETVELVSAPPGITVLVDGAPIAPGDSFDAGADVRVRFDCASTADVSGELVFDVNEGGDTTTVRVSVTVDVEEPPAPSGPRVFETVEGPDGIAIIVPDPATFAPAGLVTGRPYAAVTSSVGGVDLVDLESGARHMASHLGAYYGVVPFRDDIDAAPEMFAFHGPTGVAYTYWSAAEPGFGFTSLSSGSNVTDLEIGPLDAAGVPAAEASVHNGGPFVSVSRGGTGVLVGNDAFPGGAFPSTPVSVAFTPDGASILLLLEDGQLWFGTPGSPLTPAGATGGDMRLLECERTRADLRVCVAADYGGDAIHVIELTDDGATVTDSAPAGDGPVEPAVILDGARVLIASTGSLDGSLSLFRYDPSTSVLELAGAGALSGCLGPAHARFIAPADLVVSCNGSDALMRLDPFAQVGATP